MSNYKVFNGSEWVDICDCDLNIKNSNGNWIKTDTENCEVRFWTGSEWCTVDCSIPLVCGGELDVAFEGRGVFYVPFTITAGIKTINIYVSPSGNPDGFSIVTPDRTTKLSSIGFAGLAGPVIQGWQGLNTSSQMDPLNVYVYDGKDFVFDGQTSINFYGDKFGDVGETPMSNTDGQSMYVPNDLDFAPGTPVPSNTSNSSFCSTHPSFVNTCYVMSYTRPDDTIDEDVLIQVIGGNLAGTGWIISYVECLEET